MNLIDYTIDELKIEYSKCNDNFKKHFIKKILKHKLTLLKKEKDDLLIKNNIDKLLDDIVPDITNPNNNSDNSSNSNSNSNNSSDVLGEQYVKEIKQDGANNKLRDRMNYEIEFRKTKPEKKLIKPFYDNNNNNNNNNNNINKFFKINKFNDDSKQ